MGLYQLKNHREIFRERLREVLLIKIENEGMRRDKEYQDACLKAQAEGMPKPAKPEKYTQQSLADELGISYTTLNSYINESSKSRKRKETAPQFDQLVLFAQKLNISIDYLMGLTGYRELRPDNNWTYRAMQIEDIERSSAYIIQKDVDARKREREAGKEFMPQPEDRLDIEQHISDFTGLTQKAIRILHLYHCAAQTGRSMSSTINGLLEDTDFGGMLNDIFAMDNWEQDICPQMNKVDDFTEEEPPDFPVLTPEEMEKEAELYEQTDHSMPESSKFGWARSLEYIYDGGSVLQLIDAYLALPVRGDLQYIISRSGIAYPMKALENYNVALPTDIARCMTTGIHLLDSFYLSRICEKLREMKYKKPDTSVPW